MADRPGQPPPGVKDMADAYLNVRMIHIEDLIGKGKTQISMAEVPIAGAAPYAAADAEVTLRLLPILKKRLVEHNSAHLLEEMEMPLVPVLSRMEQTGIRLDPDSVQQMAGELAQRLAEIESMMYAKVGYPFNLNSTQQLSKVLFETLRLNPLTAARRLPAGTTPHLPTCWRNCAASTRWWTGCWNTASWPS